MEDRRGERCVCFQQIMRCGFPAQPSWSNFIVWDILFYNATSPGQSRRPTLFVYKNCTGWHILGLGGRGTHLNSIAIVGAKLANMTNKAAAEAGEVFLGAAPAAVIYLPTLHPDYCLHCDAATALRIASRIMRQQGINKGMQEGDISTYTAFFFWETQSRYERN